MRAAFTQQLAELEEQTVAALTGAAETLVTVAAAVRGGPEQLTASIAEEARKLRADASAVHSELVVITARQTPVASDLRLVLAMVELAHHTALIANQFELISQQLAAVDPATRDRAAAGDKLAVMSELASGQLRKATTAFHTRDLARARELERDDDRLDRLNREICDVALRIDASRDECELGFRHVLIARSLERIGDNGVDIAEQAEFLITAEPREFSDASRPRTKSRSDRR